MPCDDFLDIETHPETTINVYRPERQVVDDGRRYSLFRDILWEHGHSVMADVELIMVYDRVPEIKWKNFLVGTFWARESDIVGEVSDGVIIWKS